MHDLENGVGFFHAFKLLLKMRIKLFAILTLVLSTFLTKVLHAQSIITVVGSGEGYTGDGGQANAALLHWPQDVKRDTLGNMFIADANNNSIRKIDTSGKITTICGYGYLAGTGMGAYGGDGGPATAARLNSPSGVAVDRKRNVYVADYYNNCIRKIDTGGIITTIAGNGGAGFSGEGGPASAAMLYQPSRIALDTSQRIMYIADELNNRIRKIDTFGNIITIAGTGAQGYSGDGAPATSALLNRPTDVVADTFGNVYFVDKYNHAIRKIDIYGNIATIAGTGIPGYSGDGGPATAARFYDPEGIALDDSTGIYVSDLGYGRIRKIMRGIVTTIAGNGIPGFGGDGGPATSAKLYFPHGLSVTKLRNVYIADMGNNRIRYLNRSLAVTNVNEVEMDLAVFPNPCKGNFMVNIYSGRSEDVRVLLHDMRGAKVYEAATPTNRTLEVKPNAAPGLYLLTVVTEEGSWMRKVVIQ